MGVVGASLKWVRRCPAALKKWQRSELWLFVPQSRISPKIHFERLILPVGDLGARSVAGEWARASILSFFRDRYCCAIHLPSMTRI